MNFDKEVKEHYDFVVNKVKRKIIEEKIDKKEIKEIKGDSIYNLKKKLSSFLNSSSKNEFINEIEKIIYGYILMNEIFISLFDFINNNNLSYKNKVIFFLSDRISTDGNHKNNVISQLKNINTYLLSFSFIRKAKLSKKMTNNLTKGEQILFEMISIISTINPFSHFS